MLSAQGAFTQEATLGESPAPGSVRGLGGPFAKAFEKRIDAETMFPRLKTLLDEQAPFFRDTSATLNTRTYYFDREREDNTQSETWAIGGSVDITTGEFREWLSFGAGYFQSEKLVGDEDRDGARLLAPGQQGITVLGKAYATLRHEEHQAVLYRQDIHVPYVNRQDIRMIPNTFEAYRMDGGVSGGAVRYIAGYVDSIKQRDADEFISMSEAAGAETGDRGLIMSGLAFQPTPDFTTGAINHFVDDTLNIFYAETDYHHELADDLQLRYKGQFTHQQSVGDDLLSGPDFDTWVLGGQVAASYRGAILKAAFSTTDDEQQIRSPYGSYAGYISLMQKDFNRADEDAWLLGASYDFGQLGLDGFSVFANYAEGVNARDAGESTSLPDQREFNITGDYRIQKGLLRGAWVRVRWSTLDVAHGDGAADDFRVIFNYELPIL